MGAKRRITPVPIRQDSLDPIQLKVCRTVLDAQQCSEEGASRLKRCYDDAQCNGSGDSQFEAKSKSVAEFVIATGHLAHELVSFGNRLQLQFEQMKGLLEKRTKDADETPPSISQIISAMGDEQRGQQRRVQSHPPREDRREERPRSETDGGDAQRADEMVVPTVPHDHPRYESLRLGSGSKRHTFYMCSNAEEDLVCKCSYLGKASSFNPTHDRNKVVMHMRRHHMSERERDVLSYCAARPGRGGLVV